MVIDNKLDNIDELIQQSKGVISLSTDQLRSLIKDPDSYIQRQLSIFGIENGKSIEDIANLPNQTNRLIAILVGIDEIDLSQMAELTGKNPDQLAIMIAAIPDEYGLSISDQVVNINQQKVKDNLPHLIQIYYQIKPEEGLSTLSPATLGMTDLPSSDQIDVNVNPNGDSDAGEQQEDSNQGSETKENQGNQESDSNQ